MTDKNIHLKCRSCTSCERYSDGLLLLYNWVPWKYKCKKKLSLNYNNECAGYIKK